MDFESTLTYLTKNIVPFQVEEINGRIYVELSLKRILITDSDKYENTLDTLKELCYAREEELNHNSTKRGSHERSKNGNTRGTIRA